MNIDEFSDLVFRLTNAAIALPPDEHQTAQVAILRDKFTFDAAWWGWSNFSGGRDHLINTGLIGLPQSFESAVRAVLHLDPFIQTGRNLAVFGKAIDVKSANLPEEYKNCLDAYRIRSILNGHCRLQGDTEFNFFLSLYVRDSDTTFTKEDSSNFRTILRHVEQNLSLSLKSELRGFAPPNGEAALVSVGGAIVRATSGFNQRLQDCGLRPTTVQTILRDLSFGQNQHNKDGLLLKTAQYSAGLILVRLSLTDNFWGLSTEERRVADLLVDGLTMRDIASEKAVSHNTVRNQVAAIYRKTGVKSRAMLIKKMAGT